MIDNRNCIRKESEMIRILARLLIKKPTEYKDPYVRKAYGMLCGTMGILFNLLLFGGKLLAGLLSGSIAILADALNNLSDAVSSIITLLGFHLAGQKPDSEHPFGHGRFEYISGLLVAILILFMAFELIKSSVYKILHPKPLEFSVIVVVILLCSIAVKGYMAYYNRSVGKKIDSAAMHATSIDSFSDMLSTSAVLFSTVLAHTTGLSSDGYCGVLVGLFILYSGLKAAWETISPLLGQAPDPEFVEKIREIVLSQEGILGIHDLVVHNYGPGRSQISLHAEVSAQENLLSIHEKIDSVEHRLHDELGCTAVIHMDPVDDQDPFTCEMKSRAISVLSEIDPALSLHDFHIVTDPTDPQIHFDLSVPYHFSYTDEQLTALVRAKLASLPSSREVCFRYVIEIDHCE